MPTHAQVIGRYGALKSWSNTVDRSERTRNARNNSPASVGYWLDRLPSQFDNATDAQRLAAAEAGKKAYFAELAMRSAKARSREVPDVAS